MKTRLAIAVAAAAVLGSPAHAQRATEPTAQTASATAAAAADPARQALIDAAHGAALEWLATLDAGKTGESWDAAAPLLQKAVTRETWSGVGSGVRAPLGAVKSRRQAKASYTRTLPNAPEGEYVVIEYQTDFANRAGVVETVVPMRQPDGSWKVSGYFVR